MPKTLTGADSTFPSQTSPLGGESRTATSIETPFQNSADRTEFLKSRLFVIDSVGTGVRRIRNVASVTALKAETELTDRTVIVVDFVGLFQYNSTSTATADDATVVTPTSVGSGAGRWIWVSIASLDAANGVPKLDSSGRLATNKLAASGGAAKIQPASVVNGIVATYPLAVAGPVGTTAVAYADVAGASITLTMEVSDLFVFIGQAEKYQQDLTPAIHYSQWLVVKPDASTATVGQTESRNKADALNEYASLACAFYYTAAAAGSHTFKLQQKSEAGSGGATVNVKALNGIGFHIRP
jgi:hypothetical protein